MDTSTLLWITALILFICGVAAWWRRRTTMRELQFDNELDDTNTWLTTIGKVKGERPLTPLPPATAPGVVQVAPMARTDETVAFRYPEPAAGNRPAVHRFRPAVETVALPPYESHADDAVYDLLPTTENFPVITEFTAQMAADTDREIAQRARDMEEFMRDLLGAEAYSYASQAVDEAGGPKAILGGQWTP